jgi:hypothetical protein
VQAEERVADLQRREGADYSDMATSVRIAVESVRRQLDELAGQTGLSVDSPELLTRAAREIRTTDGPAIDPTILHDSPRFMGNFITVWDQFIPDLAMIGWNNRARSAKVILGAATLCTEIGWQGRKFRMFGFFYIEFNNLADFGFDANTQSFFPAFMF